MQDLNRAQASRGPSPRVVLPPSERLTTEIVGTTAETKRFPMAREAARIRRTDYAFDPAISDVCTVALVKAIDLRDADVVTLIVRVHAATFTSDGQYVRLGLYDAAPAPEEPQTLFVASLNGSSFIQGGNGPGFVDVQSMAAPLPPYAELRLDCGQDIFPGPITFSISARVLVRGRHVQQPAVLSTIRVP